MESEETDDISQLCSRLEIPAKIVRTAREILEDLLQKCPEEFGNRDKLCWFTCLVYTVSVDSRYPYGLSDPALYEHNTEPVINLTRLLTAADISVKTFFQLMTVIKEYCFLSDAVLQTIQRAEKNYCLLTVLYSKLDKIFPAILIKEDKPTSLGDQLQLAEYMKKKDLCWSMFLVSRADLAPSEQEISTAFAILLCCIMEIVCSTPSFLLYPPFDSIERENSHDRETNRTAVIRALSDQFGANRGDVIQMYEHYWQEFVKSLPKLDADFDLDYLHSRYQSSYEVDADVDALRFLEYDKLLYPEDLLSTSNPNDTPKTPVSSVLQSVRILDDIIQELDDQPSPALIQYCQNCSEDSLPSILIRLSAIETCFLEQYRKTVGNENDTVCVQRFKSTRKIYQHILQILLKIESDKAGMTAVSKLLVHDVFHRSLIACSMEIVLISHRLAYNPLNGSQLVQASRLSFPWVLTVTDISAYDFYKVIESFIKAEPRLTKEVVKHLQKVENEILESMAWKEGSPLFEAIGRAQGQYLTSVLSGSSPAKQPADLTAHDIFSSPYPVRKQPSASPVKQSDSDTDNTTDVQRPPKSASLNMFYNKVNRLAYQRLCGLCDKLDIDDDQQRRIWTCLQYCITHKPELLKGRHLDQILLCCVYSVCKISNVDLKFRTIVTAYKRMDNTSPMMYKAVLIGDGVYDSIIGFYNDVFLEPMKRSIMDFSPQRPTPQLSPIPAMRQAKNLSASPGYSVPGHKNFRISPLKRSPFKVPLTPSRMTPRTRRLYSFGEGLGSSGILRSINDSMRQLKRLKFNDAKAQTPRSLKRLKFDTEPSSSEAGAQSGQALFSRRLAETRGPSPFTMMEDED